MVEWTREEKEHELRTCTQKELCVFSKCVWSTNETAVTYVWMCCGSYRCWSWSRITANCSAPFEFPYHRETWLIFFHSPLHSCSFFYEFYSCHLTVRSYFLTVTLKCDERTSLSHSKQLNLQCTIQQIWIGKFTDLIASCLFLTDFPP